ncbi:MAG: DUF928 domain-containing protein [Nitrospira defluvii]|nr:DUF928 domain-containing protein [Nitrospira defluvii]
MVPLKLTLLLVVAMTGPGSWHNASWLPFSPPDSDAADLVTSPELRMPLYKPRKDNAPRARIGGQNRGVESGVPILIALVPDHVAFTVKGNPSLCWYLSMQTARTVTITVVDSRGIRPVLEQSLPSPIRAGIHCTRPREYGVEFKEQEAYRWFVTLVVDPDRPSQDVVAGGMIERISFDEACALGMPCTWTACNREAIDRYSESGLWYDAIVCLLELIEHDEDKQTLQRMLDHLLNQAGVDLPS